MKRLLMLVLIVAMGDAADAKDYFGIRLGFPEIGVQFGSTNIFSRNMGARLTVDFGYNNNAVLVGGDLIYTLPLATPNSALDLDIYFGAGLGFGFFTNANSLSYNLHLLLGMDFILSRDLAVFLELRPAGWGNARYYFGGALGLNFTL